jgi:hypothetical protein
MYIREYILGYYKLKVTRPENTPPPARSALEGLK